MRVSAEIVDVGVMRIVILVTMMFDGGLLLNAARKYHIDLGRLNSAAIHLLDGDADVTQAESPRQFGEPLTGGAGGKQRAEHHVSTDSRNRVQHGKLGTRHRLTICGGGGGDGRPKVPQIDLGVEGLAPAQMI